MLGVREVSLWEYNFLIGRVSYCLFCQRQTMESGNFQNKHYHDREWQEEVAILLSGAVYLIGRMFM